MVADKTRGVRGVPQLSPALSEKEEVCVEKMKGSRLDRERSAGRGSKDGRTGAGDFWQEAAVFRAL